MMDDLTNNDYDNLTACNNDDDWESFLSSNDVKWYLPQLVLLFHVFANGSVDDCGDDSHGSSTDMDDNDILHSGMPMLMDVPNDAFVVLTGNVLSALLIMDGIILMVGQVGSKALGLMRSIDGVTTANDGTFLSVMEVYSDSASSSDNETKSSASTPRRLRIIEVLFSLKYFTLAFDKEGHIWSTRNNYYGKLCLSDTLDWERFAMIPPELCADSANDILESSTMLKNGNVMLRIINVAFGEEHILLLREDGAVFDCRWNSYGQLRLGSDFANASTSAIGTSVLLPTRLP